MFKRNTFIAIIAVVVGACTVAPAYAVNYAHGLIVFENSTPVAAKVTIGNETRIVRSRSTEAFNNCCYAAGTAYHVRYETEAAKDFPSVQGSATVVPKLCAHDRLQLHGYGYLALRTKMGQFGAQTTVFENETALRGCPD